MKKNMIVRNTSEMTRMELWKPVLTMMQELEKLHKQFPAGVTVAEVPAVRAGAKQLLVQN